MIYIRPWDKLITKDQMKTKAKTIKRKSNLASGTALFQVEHSLFHLSRHAEDTCQSLEEMIS